MLLLSMQRLNVISFGLIAFHLIGKAALCRMADGEDSDHFATHDEKNAKFFMPLAMKQHPHFLAVGVGVGIDGAAKRAGLQRGDLTTDRTCPT